LKNLKKKPKKEKLN